ncbi:hypothetical protein M446_6898 [Methylobacterium sp. 4-46]|nr:hypothetical protein M446_6898 [Methylobacterium sp. 4-46]
MDGFARQASLTVRSCRSEIILALCSSLMVGVTGMLTPLHLGVRLATAFEPVAGWSLELAAGLDRGSSPAAAPRMGLSERQA